MIPREKIARLLNAYWGSRPGDWDGMVERGRQHYLSRADEILALVAGEELDPAVEWEAWLAHRHKVGEAIDHAMAEHGDVFKRLGDDVPSPSRAFMDASLTVNGAAQTHEVSPVQPNVVPLLGYIDHLDSVGALTGSVSDRLRALVTGGAA